jgi:hypothetical protein
MFVHQAVLQAAEKQICCWFEIHSLPYSCGTHITLCISLLASARFSVTCLAVLLVALTLWLQCVGIAALVAWTRSIAAGNIHNLGSFRSACRDSVNSLNKSINNRGRSLQLNMNIQPLTTT